MERYDFYNLKYNFFIDPNNPQGKPDFYIYKLIETLLPKAMIDTKNYPHINSNSESYEKSSKDKHPKCNLKMVELWAQNIKERKGWIKVFDNWNFEFYILASNNWKKKIFLN